MGRTGALSWFKCLDTYLLIQDEYSDLTTLEWRLQHVAKRMVGPGGRNQGPPGRQPAEQRGRRVAHQRRIAPARGIG